RRDHVERSGLERTDPVTNVRLDDVHAELLVNLDRIEPDSTIDLLGEVVDEPYFESERRARGREQSDPSAEIRDARPRLEDALHVESDSFDVPFLMIANRVGV